MARKGRFSFERRQRDLAKKAKREAKREARAAGKLAREEDSSREGEGNRPLDEPAPATQGGTPMKQRIYVGNLPASVREEDLEQLFSAFGPITSSVVPSDRVTETGQGFGFVDMDAAEAGRAIAALDGSDFEGRVLHVEAARVPWGLASTERGQHAYGSGDGTD
jgi:RNA recognition motif-containing protein